MIKVKYLEEIEDILFPECVEDICKSGSNDEAVEHWVNEISFSISKKNALEIIAERMGFAYYSDELEKFKKMNLKKIKEYLIWLAAWNVFENRDERNFEG